MEFIMSALAGQIFS